MLVASLWLVGVPPLGYEVDGWRCLLRELERDHVWRQEDIHQWLHECFGFRSFGWGDVSGCAMQCFGCGIQINVLLTDLLDQVCQED